MAMGAQKVNKKLPTYGEAYVFVKTSIKMEKGVWTSIVVPPHLPQMNREDAAEYYNNKLQEYWEKQCK